jgi:hypothetical protein
LESSSLPVFPTKETLEKVVYLAAQGIGYGNNVDERRISFAALYSADVSPMETALVGQFFLRKPPYPAKASHV